MAAEAQAEVQALLRFLTHDAKIPLAVALPKYNQLRKHGLSNVEAIAKSDIKTIKSIFNDEKLTKQVVNAAKRLSNPRKRAASDNVSSSPSKQVKVEQDAHGNVEAELALPETSVSIEELSHAVIETNRAPLFLAFALAVSKYTLPDQPLSSRLSLAQAVTSAGAQSKAKYIGLTDSTAEDEGWAQGQPKIKLMGRQIAVMRRHIITTHAANVDSQETIQADMSNASGHHEAFWGIDLEALKRSNGPLVASGRAGTSTGPPTHKPQAARSYLLKSIDLIEEDVISIKKESDTTPTKDKKMTGAAKAERKERAVAMLLKTIDYVCSSWSETISTDDLDRRASAWYAKVRPDVAQGQSGWGQRGKVSLQDIIDLAKVT